MLHYNAQQMHFQCSNKGNLGLKGVSGREQCVEQSLNLCAERALHMAELTLQKMGAGGIHDHLGGGFARYSVDEKWHVPHFEKM